MNSNDCELIMQRWSLMQTEILPCFNDDFGILTPKLEKLIHILALTRIEDFVQPFGSGAVSNDDTHNLTKTASRNTVLPTSTG